MERGYLAGLLLVLAVFTGMSHGFRSLEQWSSKHIGRVAMMAMNGCRTHSAKRGVAKLEMQLSPRCAEQARLLAELNLPSIIQSNATEIARERIDGMSCARARAMQEAERARRDMLRAQRDLMQIRVEPMSVKVDLPPDFEQRIQQSTQAAMQLAKQQVQLQIDANRMNAIRQMTIPQQ